MTRGAIAGFANVDLWYNLLNPSRLGLGDRARAIGIIGRIRSSGADMFGLAECFSRPLAEMIVEGVRDLYPVENSILVGPWGTGIQGIIDKYASSPRLARFLAQRADPIANALFGRHNDPESSLLDGVLRYIKGDPLGWALERALRLPLFCGSGLVFLSKYPVEFDQERDFFLHPVSADVERLAAKGVARIRVHHPLADLTVFLTHLQAGDSPMEIAARREQILQLKRLIDASPDPVILMGDLNVTAGTPEYLWMCKTLGLIDSHEGTADGTWFPHRSNRGHASGKPARLDYILLSRILRAAAPWILSLVDPGGNPFSDHDGVVAKAAFAG